MFGSSMPGSLRRRDVRVGWEGVREGEGGAGRTVTVGQGTEMRRRG